MNFHDETGEVFSKFKLSAGDDAGDVAWCVITGAFSLPALTLSVATPLCPYGVAYRRVLCMILSNQITLKLAAGDDAGDVITGAFQINSNQIRV